MTVLLATSADLPLGEPGAASLDAALQDRGIDFSWTRWDDPDVDWHRADLVAVRSTWDYCPRHREFLAWARSLDQTRLLNGADVFDWNHDKRYLTELGELPVVPTVAPHDRAELTRAVSDLGSVVVKPRVGAGGAGLMVVNDPEDLRLDAAGGPWVVQPLVESIRTTGEVSVYVLGGALAHRFDKRPGPDDVRVNEEFGGQVEPAAMGDAATLALRAEAAMTTRFDRPMDYLRVDMVRWEGQWAVSELELIEPGLYLDVSPANAAPFAALVESRLNAVSG